MVFIEFGVTKALKLRFANLRECERIWVITLKSNHYTAFQMLMYDLTLNFYFLYKFKLWKLYYKYEYIYDS